MVDRLLARLPDLELAGDTPPRAANFISGYEAMPVGSRRRNPSSRHDQPVQHRSIDFS